MLPGGAVGVRVVRGARHGGRQHRQDPDDQRDVGRRALVKQIQDDDQEEDPDRRIGQDGMQRVAQPSSVEKVPDGRDGPEEGMQPAVIEVAEWPSPAGLCGDEPVEESMHRALLAVTLRRLRRSLRFR